MVRSTYNQGLGYAFSFKYKFVKLSSYLIHVPYPPPGVICSVTVFTLFAMGQQLEITGLKSLSQIATVVRQMIIPG